MNSCSLLKIQGEALGDRGLYLHIGGKGLRV